VQAIPVAPTSMCGIKTRGVFMNHFGKILVTLLTVALPAIGQCVETGATPAVVESAQAAPKAAAAIAEDPNSVSGKVIETMNGGGYTYAYLEKLGVKSWAACPPLAVTVGQELTLINCIPMGNFSSKSLGKKFDSIYFCGGPKQVASKDSETKVASAKTTANGATAAKIDKATGENAYTVAEIYAGRTKLDTKQVVVKAKVVKVSAGIMGKNWIHLQDGSGDPKQNNNNLVVTSQDLPAVGAVVTASGTLYKDKDFGGGYRYEVILEQTTIK
jgi:hypothetical protein